MRRRTRQAWASPTAHHWARVGSAWAGLGVLAWQLAVWATSQPDPIWGWFRAACVVGLWAVLAFIGWGTLSAMVGHLEFSRPYDLPEPSTDVVEAISEIPSSLH